MGKLELANKWLWYIDGDITSLFPVFSMPGTWKQNFLTLFVGMGMLK